MHSLHLDLAPKIGLQISDEKAEGPWGPDASVHVLT